MSQDELELKMKPFQNQYIYNQNQMKKKRVWKCVTVNFHTWSYPNTTMNIKQLNKTI